MPATSLLNRSDGTALVASRAKRSQTRRLWLGTGIAAATASAMGLPAAARASDPVARGRVSVFEMAMLIPQLGTTRTIRLYLPPSYGRSGRRYRVIYMLDGQNLFDAATSFAGEWQVDETLDRLAAQDDGRWESIVVGVDNGGANRTVEYHPINPDTGQPGLADATVAFLADTLKPLVDSRLQTLRGPEDTLIMGASSGATLALHAGFTRPEVFGRIGGFSAPLWLAPSPMDEVMRLRPQRRGSRVALVAGARERVGRAPQGIFARDLPAMKAALARAGYRDDQVWVRAIADGTHSEAFWGQMFEPVLRFLAG